MHRLIYLDLEYGYKSVDITSRRNLQYKQDLIVERGDHVICTLDSNNTLNAICDCFDAHADFVNACYLRPW